MTSGSSPAWQSSASERAPCCSPFGPATVPVLVAEALHGFASCIINPAIASMTLAIVGHGAFGERVGTNTRYAAIGAAAAALLLGGAGWWIADRGPLLMTALLTLPTLGAVASVRVLRPRSTAAGGRAPRLPAIRACAGRPGRAPGGCSPNMA